MSNLSRPSTARTRQAEPILPQTRRAILALPFLLGASSAQAAVIQKQRDDSMGDNELVKNLLKRSEENKAKWDKDRIDRFYNRDYAINKVGLGTILTEPCDPREVEFMNDKRCITRPLPGPEDPLDLLK